MVCPISIVHSEIVDYELNSPFTYLRQVSDNNHSFFDLLVSSTWVRLGASEKRAPFERRSSPVNPDSSPSKDFESPLVEPPINDIETFLVELRFEKRNLLAELPCDLVECKLK
jgi:hypothetical protein